MSGRTERIIAKASVRASVWLCVLVQDCAGNCAGCVGGVQGGLHSKKRRKTGGFCTVFRVCAGCAGFLLKTFMEHSF